VTIIGRCFEKKYSELNCSHGFRGKNTLTLIM
jgi:hypothetical protein